MGLFLAFVEVSMGGRNASGSEREIERKRAGDRDRVCNDRGSLGQHRCQAMCVCFLACCEQLNKAGRQVSAQQRAACFPNLRIIL